MRLIAAYCPAWWHIITFYLLIVSVLNYGDKYRTTETRKTAYEVDHRE